MVLVFNGWRLVVVVRVVCCLVFGGVGFCVGVGVGIGVGVGGV